MTPLPVLNILNAKGRAMEEYPPVEEVELICSCGELHKGHICWLTNMGLLSEVYHLTSMPTVSCRKCGAKANLPHNVCFSTPLDG